MGHNSAVLGHRYPRVFHRLTIGQQTPGFWDVTISPKLYPNGLITCLGYNKSNSIFVRNKIKIKTKVGICIS